MEFSPSSLKLVHGAWLLSFGFSVLPLLFDRSAILWNLLQALPAVLALSYCAIRASLRLCLLEPSFFFASRLLFLFSTVHSLLTALLLSAVKLLHRESRRILVAATVFVALSPLPYLLRRNIYLRTCERDEEIKKSELCIHFLNFMGALLAVIWALIAKPLLVRDTFQLLFEAFGIVLITNIVVGDYLVQSLVEYWHLEKGAGTTHATVVETVFAPFYRELYPRKPDLAASEDGEHLSDTKPCFSVDVGVHEAFRLKVIDVETESSPAAKKEPAVV